MVHVLVGLAFSIKPTLDDLNAVKIATHRIFERSDKESRCPSLVFFPQAATHRHTLRISNSALIFLFLPSEIYQRNPLVMLQVEEVTQTEASRLTEIHAERAIHHAQSRDFPQHDRSVRTPLRRAGYGG